MTIISKPNTPEFEENFDKIFKKQVEETPEEKITPPTWGDSGIEDWSTTIITDGGRDVN